MFIDPFWWSIVCDHRPASDVGAEQRSNLATALSSARLLQYEEALRGLGVVEPLDLAELEEDDLGACFLSFTLDHLSLLNEIGLKICRRDCSGARPEENRDQAAAAHGVRVEVVSTLPMQPITCNPLLANIT